MRPWAVALYGFAAVSAALAVVTSAIDGDLIQAGAFVALALYSLSFLCGELVRGEQ